MSRWVVPVLAALLLLGTPGAVRGAPVTYFGEDTNPGSSTANSDGARNNFLSAVATSLTAENFESFSGGATAPLSLGFQGSLTATLTGSTTLRNTGSQGHYAISGSNYWYLSGSNSFTITFSTAIAAFGIYGTDAGDWGGRLSFQWGTGSAVNVAHSTGFFGSTSGRQIFYGYIDTANPVTSITISNSNFIDQIGFDDVYAATWAEVVPEPGTLLLMALGLAGAGAAIRRRAGRTRVSGNAPSA